MAVRVVAALQEGAAQEAIGAVILVVVLAACGLAAGFSFAVDRVA